uniref:Formin-like protein n=1 Tax=Meloidogyne javanica TaxID=6303 RepID=A0A915M5W7_MELJA
MVNRADSLAMSIEEYPRQQHYHSATSSSSNGGGNLSGQQQQQHSSLERTNSMPPESVVLAAFEEVLKQMDLPPDKMRTLRNCDLKKKWDLVCDQRKFSVDHSVPDPKQTQLTGYSESFLSSTFKLFIALIFKNSSEENGIVPSSSNPDLSYSQTAVNIQFINSSTNVSSGGGQQQQGGGGGTHNQLGTSGGSSTCSLQTNLNNNTNITMNSSIYSNNRDDLSFTSGKLKNSHNSRKLYSSSKGTDHIDDDIHVGICCLRALLNNKFGVVAVFSNRQAIYCIVRAILHPSFKTKALVLDMLSAIVTLTDGHELVLGAFNKFRSAYNEIFRFQTLVRCFKCPGVNVDFLASCIKFINVMVHSSSDMNQRVALQYEFTIFGLDRHLEANNSRQKEEFQQLQADCYVQIAQLNAQLKKLVEDKLELERQKVNRDMHISTLTKDWREKETKFENEKGELERRITMLEQTKREIQQSLKISQQAAAQQAASVATVTAVVTQSSPALASTNDNIATSTNNVSGALSKQTLVGEHVLDLSSLEELFCVDGPPSGNKVTEKQSKEDLVSGGQSSPPSSASSSIGVGVLNGGNTKTLLGTKRLQNIAIIRRKLGKSIMEIMSGVHRFDLSVLSPDQVEILLPIVPTQDECTKLKEFASSNQNPSNLNNPWELLTAEDQFLAQLMGIERLSQKLLIMKFMGDFNDSVRLLIPQIQKVTAAAKSVHNSKKFPKIIEIILAIGNAMNGQRRAPVYGFRLSSLDALSILKSPKDRNVTLLHCIVELIADKFPHLLDFSGELKLAENGATVNMETIGADVKDIETKFGQVNLKIINSSQEAFGECAEYFGEVPGRIQPDVFFTRIVSFCKHFEQARTENEAKRKAEQRQLETQQKRRSAQTTRRSGGTSSATRGGPTSQDLILNV